jgi:hypothetical protein
LRNLGSRVGHEMLSVGRFDSHEPRRQFAKREREHEREHKAKAKVRR